MLPDVCRKVHEYVQLNVMSDHDLLYKVIVNEC